MSRIRDRNRIRKHRFTNFPKDFLNSTTLIPKDNDLLRSTCYSNELLPQTYGPHVTALEAQDANT